VILIGSDGKVAIVHLSHNKGVVMGVQLDQFENFWNGIVDEIRSSKTRDRVHPVVFDRWEVWLSDNDEVLHYRSTDEALETEHQVTKDQMMIHFIKDVSSEAERRRWLELYCEFKKELVGSR
jgi:hypothetical protein